MSLSYLQKYEPNTISDICLSSKQIYFLNYIVSSWRGLFLYVGKTDTGKTTIIRCIMKQLTKERYLYINGFFEQNLQQFIQKLSIFIKSSYASDKQYILIDNIDALNVSFHDYIKECVFEFKKRMLIFATSSCSKKIASLLPCSLHITIHSYEKERVKTFLTHVLEREKIHIEQNAVDMLVQMTRFSCRSILVHAEKLKMIFDDKYITTNMLNSVCSSINYNNLQHYTDAVFKQQNIRHALKFMQTIVFNGYSVIDILETYYLFINSYYEQLDSTLILNIYKIISKYIAYFHTSFEHDRIIYSFTYDMYKLSLSNNSQRSL